MSYVVFGLCGMFFGMCGNGGFREVYNAAFGHSGERPDAGQYSRPYPPAEDIGSPGMPRVLRFRPDDAPARSAPTQGPQNGARGSVTNV